MSLDYVILGILERRPSTGYDLSKIMDRTTNFYWQATHAQIHQRLKRLQKDGMVKEKRAWEKGRPARIIYNLTSKGGRALVDWEKTPPEDLAVRHGFLSQFNSSYVLEVPEIVKKVDIHQRRSQERLDLHKEAMEIIKRKNLAERKNQVDYLMALYGVMFEQTCQDWCEEAKRFLDENNNTAVEK